MLRNDADGVRRIIENIAAQEGVDSVRIYNKEGRVRVSSRAEEGTLVDKHSDECIACHAGPQPKAGLERGDRIRMLQADGGGRVLGIITPIYNEAGLHGLPRPPGRPSACSASSTCGCRMAQADAALRASERQMQYGLFATGLAVLLLSFALLFVLRDAAGEAAAARDGARRRRRPRRARAGALRRRDGRPGPLLERR